MQRTRPTFRFISTLLDRQGQTKRDVQSTNCPAKRSSRKGPVDLMQVSDQASLQYRLGQGAWRLSARAALPQAASRPHASPKSSSPPAVSRPNQRCRRSQPDFEVTMTELGFGIDGVGVVKGSTSHGTRQECTLPLVCRHLVYIEALPLEFNYLIDIDNHSFPQ